MKHLSKTQTPRCSQFWLTWTVGGVLICILGGGLLRCGGYARYVPIGAETDLSVLQGTAVKFLERRDLPLPPSAEWGAALEDARLALAEEVLENRLDEPLPLSLRTSVRSVSRIQTDVRAMQWVQDPMGWTEPTLIVGKEWEATARLSRLRLTVRTVDGEDLLFDDLLSARDESHLNLPPRARVILRWSVGSAPQTPRCGLLAGAEREYRWGEGQKATRVDRQEIAGRMLTLEADLLLRVGGRAFPIPALRRIEGGPIPTALPPAPCPGLYD